MRNVTTDDLVQAVQDGLSKGKGPIIWSRYVTDWFKANNLNPGRSMGDPFNLADIDACSTGRLQKWKCGGTGRSGWSPPKMNHSDGYGKAESAAIENGILRVKREGESWVYEWYDTSARRWVTQTCQ